MKKFLKKIIRALVRYSLYSCFFLFGFLPYAVTKWMTKALSFLVYVLMHRKRRHAFLNLKRVFGETKTKREIYKLEKSSFLSFGEGIAELIRFYHDSESVMENIRFSGRENLDRILEKGNGAVILTAHFGNFPLMMLYCAKKGYKVNVIIKPTRDKEIGQNMVDKMSQFGFKTIWSLPRRKCVTQSMQALRKNELLFILPDQNFGQEGCVFVDFLGKSAATGPGPVIFTQRAETELVPMFMVRQKNGTHEIIIEKPLDIKRGIQEDDLLKENVQLFTSKIEEYILTYPDHWIWMHKRWKTRPKKNA